MGFNAKEKSIIEWGKANGKTRQEVEKAINNYRTGVNPANKTTADTKRTSNTNLAVAIEETKGDIKQTFGNMKKTVSDTRTKMESAFMASDRGEQSGMRTLGQAFGAGALGVSKLIGDGTVGAVKVALEQKDEDSLKKGIGAVVAPVVNNQTVQNVSQNIKEKYESLDDKTKRDLDAIFGVGALATEFGIGGVGKRFASFGVKKGSEATNAILKAGSNTKSVISAATKALPENKVIQGVTQFGKEFLERIPRASQKIEAGIESAALKSERLKNATPVVRQAIKSELDDRIINTVVDADEYTIKAYKEMLDIADTPGTKLKPEIRHEIVAGRAAGAQYKTIDTARKSVGKQIGETVDKLSATQNIDIATDQTILRDILNKQGISVTDDGLNFSGSRFTPAERLRINELYNLSNEGGANLTPRQLYDKDQLFSKLQRETRMEGIGDIIIDVGGEKQNMFQVFRDVFSDTLETNTPQIKELNREYRKLVTLQDDLDNSIIKSGNFQTTGNVDPSVFAQTNLRRILSDAQSAADYREILNKMDTLSRELGYQGARPDELIAFATELRKIYPNTIPATGLPGSIRTGLIDIAMKVVEAGTPGLKDQQKALRALVETFERGSDGVIPNKQGGFIKNPLGQTVSKKPELFTTPQNTKERGMKLLEKAFGDKESAISHAEQFWAKDGKDGVFHHATKETAPFSLFDKKKAANMDKGLRTGVSNVNGLYVGRDVKALHEFYNIAGERGENIITYKGNPKLFDLTDEVEMQSFVKKFDTGAKIEKELSRNGYDGLKYFDPYSTGEEIIITNLNSVKTTAFNGKPIERIKSTLPTLKVKGVSAKEAVAKGMTEEQWIKEQGTPLYRGGQVFDIKKFDSKHGMSLSFDKDISSKFVKENGLGRPRKGGVLEELFLDNQAKIATIEDIPEEVLNPRRLGLKTEPLETEIVAWANKNGFDAINMKGIKAVGIHKVEKEVRVLNPNILKTSSELRAEYQAALKASKL